MTSNTAPYGTAFASNSDSGYGPYRAFDKNKVLYWQYTTGNSAYVGYSFINPISVKKVVYTPYGQLEDGSITNNAQDTIVKHTVRIKASNDKETWVELANMESSAKDSTDKTFNLSNNRSKYLHYMLSIDNYNSYAASTKFVTVNEVQFYGR